MFHFETIFLDRYSNFEIHLSHGHSIFLLPTEKNFSIGIGFAIEAMFFVFLFIGTITLERLVQS